MMRRTLSSLLLLLSLCWAPLAAANIHAILVVDVNACDINFSTKRDLAHTRENLGLIAELTGLQLVEHVLIKQNFTAESVLARIDTLDVDEDDCVVFYYAGHGFRNHRNSSELPALMFGPGQESLDLASVVERIECKLPRMLLAMADCCNTYLSGRDTPMRRAPKFWFWEENEDRTDENLHYLFAEFQGVVVSAAAQPSDPAISLVEGGLFSVMFWDTLFTRAQDTEGLEWETVCEETQSRTYYNTVMPGLQMPIYFVFAAPLY